MGMDGGFFGSMLGGGGMGGMMGGGGGDSGMGTSPINDALMQAIMKMISSGTGGGQQQQQGGQGSAPPGMSRAPAGMWGPDQSQNDMLAMLARNPMSML